MGKSALTWAWLQRDVLGRPLPGLAQDPPEVADICRVPEAARPEGVLWWSFYEREAKFVTFLDKTLTYASGGSVDPRNVPSAHEKTQMLVNLLQQRRLLLVLDGFERELRAYAGLSAAYQGDAVAEDARGDFRACTDPHAATFLRWAAALPLRSRVLLTSRLFPRELDGLAGCQRERLSSLDPKDAVIFFHAQGVRGTRAEIQSACQPYGYHPLALRLLAGMIVRDRRKPGDVRVASRRSVLPQLRGKERHHILQVAYDALDRRKRELLSSISAFRSPMSYEALSTFDPYKSEEQFDAALDELLDRGLLLCQEESQRYDLHPIVRRYAYDRLADKTGVHTRLRDYFAAVPAPEEEQVQSVEDLALVIELYHHTVRAGRYDEALELLHDRLIPNPLYYRFGTYQTCVELLRALFPDGEDHPPCLKEESDQAWTLNELANSYSFSGQSRRAVPLFEASNAIDERRGDKEGVAIGLGNLANRHIELGELPAAEGNLRHGIALCREIEDEFWEAAGHQELGRLLAYRGAFADSTQEFDAALEFEVWRINQQGVGINWAYRALRALLMGNTQAALEVARRARELADVRGYERDIVRAEWLLGAALVALSQETGFLTEAETHLTEALTRCRRINMVDHEPDILLAWARWHRAEGNTEQARQHAQEALAIANRCEYRLKQADIHNFLAHLAFARSNELREMGNEEATTQALTEARRQAEVAKERAWCDGPPHCYKPALDETERLLEEIPQDCPE